MFVRPTAGADIGPQLCFFRTDESYADRTVVLSRRLLDGPIKDVAELDRPIVAGAEQLQRGNPSKWAHLMRNRSSAIQEEVLKSSKIPSPKVWVIGDSRPSKTA